MSGIDNSERPNGQPQATVGTPRAREVPALLVPFHRSLVSHRRPKGALPIYEPAHATDADG